MEAMTLDWVEKIFGILEDWFGDKWTEVFSPPGRKSIAIIIWQNGLAGLTYDEVRNALRKCKELAKYNQIPPTNIEFWHYAKNIPLPINTPTKSHAKSHLATIRQTLGRSRGYQTGP
jgi:hypothetical protein